MHDQRPPWALILNGHEHRVSTAEFRFDDSSAYIYEKAKMTRQVLKRPTVFFLPTISRSPLREDVQLAMRQAFKLWQGEDIIWMLPELKLHVRWLERKYASPPFEALKDDASNTLLRPWQGPIKAFGAHRLVLGIPSPIFDCVRVFHLSPGGAVFGHDAELFFNGGRVEPLLENCIKPDSFGEFFNCPLPQTALTCRPVIKNALIDYEIRELELSPGPSIPITKTSYSTRETEMEATWPPPVGIRPSISPELESRRYYGPTYRLDTTLPVSTGHLDGSLALANVILWPGPLGELMPNGFGLDDLFTLTSLSNAAKLSQTDLGAAERMTRELAQPYLTSSQSTLGDSWFGPLSVEKGLKAALWDLDSRYSVSTMRIEELLESEEGNSRLSQRQDVDRAWGVPGLAAALLLGQLELNRPILFCKSCGRPIIGATSRREYCSKKESLQCSNARNAFNQRSHRKRVRHQSAN